MHGVEVLPNRSARVGVEPSRQPNLRMDAAGPEIHRRGAGWPDRQLDDADP